MNLHSMYIYKSLQAYYLNIHFFYHCSIPAGFPPNSRDAVENGCGIPYALAWIMYDLNDPCYPYIAADFIQMICR